MLQLLDLRLYPQMARFNTHNELSLMALTWLSNKVTGKGYRGTTEVCIGPGYVADVVALCSLQYRYWQQYSETQKIPTIKDYHIHHKNCKPNENVKVNYMACIFEAKAKRNDFLSTFNNSEKHKNRHKPIGNLHWIVSNKDVAQINEIPDFWGLLIPSGTGLREIKQPVMQSLIMADLDKIAHALIWPIQAYRKYIICECCGSYVNKGYCLKCGKSL